MSSEIRKFFPGRGDSEKREAEKQKSLLIKREKKTEQSQKDYDRTKCKRLTHDCWSEEFPLLERKDAEIFCSVCRKYPILSVPDSSVVKDINENYRKETLKFHNPLPDNKILD